MRLFWTSFVLADVFSPHGQYSTGEADRVAHVEVGGKDLIHSQEDSQLQALYLETIYIMPESDITLYLKHTSST